MDDSPWFDAPDQFDQRRIRLADIDGSGTTDIIYLRRGRRHGSTSTGPATRWSAARGHRAFPIVDDLDDRRGRGPARQRHRLPGLVVAAARRRPAPRALRRPDGRSGSRTCWSQTRNNLGARRESSTRRRRSSILRTSAAGRPWITKLPFPGALRRAGHRRPTTGARPASRPPTAITTATSTASSASSAASARVEQVDVEIVRHVRRRQRRQPVRHRRPDALPAAGQDHHLVPHRRRARPRAHPRRSSQSEYFPNSLAALPGTSGVDAASPRSRCPSRSSRRTT